MTPIHDASGDYQLKILEKFGSMCFHPNVPQGMLHSNPKKDFMKTIHHRPRFPFPQPARRHDGRGRRNHRGRVAGVGRDDDGVGLPGHLLPPAG